MPGAVKPLSMKRRHAWYTVCAVLAQTCGTARLLDLIKLVQAVNAIGGKRCGKPLH